MTNFVVADYTSQPVAIQSRIVQLISLLQQDSDNIACYIQQYGIPEVAGLRAQVWSRCIARYFTSPCYTVSSSSYWDLIAKYYRYPNQHLLETRAADNDSNHTSSYDDISVDDHPLNPSNDSIWQQYFSDQHLLRRIRMDTVRTHPDWHVFRQREPCMNRILFLFAKLHPELGYIQGMNELAAPFVYVYLWDGSVDWEPRREGEAFVAFDSFFSSFIAPLYQNTNRIQQLLVQAQNLLAQWDPPLWQHFHRQQVEWQFFATRWLQLCLCREFELPELLKIWDVLLSISNPFLRWNWLTHFIVVMVMHARDALLSCCSFQQCISLLQHYTTSCHMDESQIFHLLLQTQQKLHNL